MSDYTRRGWEAFEASGDPDMLDLMIHDFRTIPSPEGTSNAEWALVIWAMYRAKMDEAMLVSMATAGERYLANNPGMEAPPDHPDRLALAGWLAIIGEQLRTDN